MPIRTIVAAVLLAVVAPCPRAWSDGDTAEVRSVSELLEAMASGEYQTRRKAVLAAEGRGDAALLERLLDLAARDGHPNIRGYAAEVLGSYRDERIFRVLLHIARTDRFPSPRNAAYEAMGRICDARAWAPLRAALDDPGTAPYAARGLAHGGRREAWDAICTAYRRDVENPYAADLIPEALVELDPERAEAFLLDVFADAPDTALYRLVRLLRDRPSPAVRAGMEGLLAHEAMATRQSAIQVLGRAGDAGTVDRLLALLDRDVAKPADLAFITRSLGEIGDARAATRLEEALGAAASGGDRAAIAEALGLLAQASSAAPLIRALDAESDPRTTVVEIHALSRIGGPDARAAIARRVPDEGEEDVSRQPRTISSVWAFPWNVRVSAMALWALAALDEGRPPFPVEELSTFPPGRPSDWERGARARFEAADR